MYLGIDGFSNGWCCCSFNGDMTIKIIPEIKSILDYENYSKILIDIPIGLSSKNVERKIDSQMRKLLPSGRKNSVFNAPSRKSAYSNTYDEAKKSEIELTGKSLSIQSWNITNKIKEVDQFLTINSQLTNNVYESHPELCFYYLNNMKPLIFSKKTIDGFNERMKILNHYHHQSQELLDDFFKKNKKTGIKKDDIADSMVLCISAKNWIKNGKRTINNQPTKDEKGISFGIHF